MLQVLVTGAAGRVGQWVVRELAAHGHRVRALDRRPLPKDLRGNERVETVYADIADPLAMMAHVQGCDAISHLAAYPSPSVPSAELLRVNVIGTHNLLEAAMANDVPRVVLTSSIGALGFSFPTHPCLPDYLPIDVAHPRRPQDVYGLSKVMNEESAAAATRLSGMTTIVLRPPAVFDMVHARDQGWLARMVERGKEHVNKDFWAYVDVRDFAVACRLALESDLTGHHIFWTMADDVSTDATVAELTERFLPQFMEYLPRLTGKSFYDLTPTADRLGFVAQHTWRGVLESGERTGS